MPSAMVSTASSRTGAPASSEARIAAAPSASTPTTRTPGRTGQRGRDAGDEAAAADRHHDRLDVGALVGDLEPDRALAGDDQRVVERRHERGAPASAARSGREPCSRRPSSPTRRTSAP